MKRIWWLVLVVLLCLGVAALILYKKSSSSFDDNQASWAIGEVSGNWEKIRPIAQINQEELAVDPNEDGLHNRTLLRGFFDEYNEQNNELTLKAEVVYPKGVYRKAKFKISPNPTIYCAPSVFVNEPTGETVYVQEMGLLVKNEQTMVLPAEQLFSFAQFLEKTTDRTYLFVQLTNDFNINGTNYISKIVVIGLCD